jgi:beta-N-acetylhexosaminidase
MSRGLNEKIGQLFCASLRWDELKDVVEVRSHMDRFIEMGVGGLILYGGDLEETPRILKDLQGRLETPLLIMADMETGPAQQIQGGTEFPSMMAIGASRSRELARRVGRATALEANSLGINLLLSPVLDVNTNPLNPIVGVRAFGGSPTLVADLGAEYLKGCQETGVIATAKHFPGHGDTDLDSHITLPVVRRGPGRLRELEIPPFKKAISEGVMAVMVGHIAIPAVTGSESRPASLSREIVIDILRTELGFKGLVMSDAMIMEGVREFTGEKGPVIEALQAGIDILVYVDDVQRSIEVVQTALEDGSLDPGIVEEALMRVSVARNYLDSKGRQKTYPLRKPRSSEHQQLACEVADLSATLLRNRNALLPVTSADKGVFVIYEDDEPRYEMILPQRLREVYPEWQLISIDHTRRELSIEQTEQVKATSKVILFVFSPVRACRGVSDLSPDGRLILDKIFEMTGSSGLVSLGSPYMMRLFPRIDGYLCLYSHSVASQESALKVIGGDLKPSGKLPVSIPGLYPCDWGISYG